MVTIKTFKTLALSFPETVELPHFHLTSFRVGKKIFATLDTEKNRAMISLSTTEQSVFCSFDKGIIYPVPGGWGKKGSTFFELKKIRKEMLQDALSLAYRRRASKKLIAQLDAR